MRDGEDIVSARRDLRPWVPAPVPSFPQRSLTPQAAKKAALAKALSAAYLEHQIADLESKVNAIGVDGPGPSGAPRGGARPAAVAKAAVNGEHEHAAAQLDGHHRHHHQYHGEGSHAHPPHHHHHHAHHHHAHHHNHNHQHLHPLQGAGRIDDSSGSSPSSSSSDSEPEFEWRVAVVDVSALMWAPRSVRSLVQRGFEVIVPLDAIRTLDMLKKGNSPVAQAARAAARFVEHASRHWRAISTDPSIAVQAGTDYKKGRGLRLQREVESAAPAAAGAGAPPPKWVASVLGAAAFFTTIVRAEEAAQGRGDEPRPAVLIAHPPLSAEVGPPPVDERPDRDAAPASRNLAERAEGYTVSLEAGRFELPLEVLRDDDEADAEPVRGARGRGRGHGHGGGGRGRRGERGGHGHRRPEPEPEVKILLRRPDDPRPPSAPQAPLPPQPPVPAPAPGPTDDEHRGGRRGRGRGRGRPQQDRGGAFTLLQRPGPPLAHHVRGDPRDLAQVVPGPDARRRNNRNEREREREAARDTARDARDAARDTARDSREAVREQVRAGKEAVREARENAREQARGVREQAREQRDRDREQRDRDHDRERADWPLRRAYASADMEPVERPRVVLLQRPR